MSIHKAQVKGVDTLRYEGSVYRPPSEAYSLIIQATIGCSHNKCSFCSMYKDKQFRIRPVEDVVEDLETARVNCRRVEKVFIADGNALAVESQSLMWILTKIKQAFPECRSVGIYSAPKDILAKSVQELSELQALGLTIAYLGIESGSDQILRAVEKGVTAREIIEAGRKVRKAGIKLSATVISGLGGQEYWEEHAKASAQVVNAINPEYLALLTLLIQPGTRLYDAVQMGEFKLLSPQEVMQETAVFIKNLAVEQCVFRSNHASNYLPLAGTLPEDKVSLLQAIASALNEDGNKTFKNETLRRL